MILFLLCFQVLPLIAFPPSTYTATTQEWWLPVILTFLVVVALVQVIGRHSEAVWPWYIVSFAQGVNIISRLMMLMPHATLNRGGVQVLNTPYVIVAAVCMVLSAFEIWYGELPEVRRTLLTS